MAILSLTGKLQAGKDLTGRIIQALISDHKYPNLFNKEINGLLESVKNEDHHWVLDDRSDWKIKKCATKLKMVAALILGVPVEKFEDNEYKDSYLGPEWESYGYANGFNHEYRDGEKMKTIMNVAFCDKERYEIEKRVNWQTAYHNKMTVREFLQRLGTEAVRNVLHQNTWVNALFAEYKELPGTIRKKGKGNPISTFGPARWRVPDLPCYPVEHHGKILFSEEFEYDEPVPSNTFPSWIITDTRFPNEFDAVRKHEGICVKVHRPVDLRLPELYELWPDRQLLIEPDEAAFMEWLADHDRELWKKYNHVSETAWESQEFDYTLINDCDLETYVERVKEMLQHFKIISNDTVPE